MTFDPKIAILLALACLPPTPAAAQHKCVGPNGAVTLQQIPCPGALGVVRAPIEAPAEPAEPPIAAVNQAAEELCKARAPAHFKDPDSVRILSFGAVPKMTDSKRAAFYMEINARNGFGGYGGAKTYLCMIDRKTSSITISGGY